jgi:hypothetical protein
MRGDGLPDNAAQTAAGAAVRAWRAFADRLQVIAPNGSQVSWTDYLKRYIDGRADERTIVGPVAFPAFAEQILGFAIGQTLAAEVSGVEGRPDFTPADAVTHPFVFEIKGTDGRETLTGHDEQVTRYLREGRDRIKRVVLTNLFGLRVFEFAPDQSHAREVLDVNLRLLATIPVGHAITHPHAQRLADFLAQYRFQMLGAAEKIERIRQAPPWNPSMEITSTGWVLQRLDSVVEGIRFDVWNKVRVGVLLDRTWLPDADRPIVERELRELDKRVGSSDADADARTLADYLDADEATNPGLARKQFISHTAFYTATRLLLVRAWEDYGLLNPALLYDGGFDQLMRVIHQQQQRSGD